MSFFRLITIMLIAAGLLVSTSMGALSQGRMAGSQVITICSPLGAHEIILGASGEPIPGEHECADCCFFGLDIAEHPTNASTTHQHITRIVLPVTVSIWFAQSVNTAKARAPPSLV